MAEPLERIEFYAEKYSTDELFDLASAAEEAVQTSSVVSRSVQGQSVTIDPERADVLFDRYIAARKLRIAADAESTTASAISQTEQEPRARGLDFSRRYVE